MYWIALQPTPHEDAKAWGWRALQFTPRVAFVDEALLLEVGASERLFGGRKHLLRRLLRAHGMHALPWAPGPTGLVALSLLRLQREGQSLPLAVPWGLPLSTFTAAQPHVDTLERIGVTTLGELRDLPRAGVARRFGSELLDALDRAWGDAPERYDWLTLPSAFDENQELPELATSAPELLLAAAHLLKRLQAWLQGRNLGVLALELEWTLDLRRIDGKPLPPTEKLELRTAQPTQDMRHLRRLASERLARAALSAPANHLRLRTLQTVPWGGRTTSLLPEDQKQGEHLHELVERLSVRLGEKNVTVVQPRQDHRPEAMQEWVPALSLHEPAPGTGKTEDVLYPPWLLTEPLRLQVKGDQPFYQGPLQLLTRARRIETSWWNSDLQAPVSRDYFIARSEQAGLLWIFRERLSADQEHAQWFLHGLYA